MRIVDLSVPIEHDHPSEPVKPQIAYDDHAQTAEIGTEQVSLHCDTLTRE